MNLTENPNPADRTPAAGLSGPAPWHFPNTCATADTGSDDIRVSVQDLWSRARLGACCTTPGWIRGQTPLTQPAEAMLGTGACCSAHAWERKRGFEPENRDPVRAPRALRLPCLPFSVPLLPPGLSTERDPEAQPSARPSSHPLPAFPRIPRISCPCPLS